MLPLWPAFSPVAQCYTRRMERMVKAEGTAVGRRQDALLATWSFDERIRSPTFSPDGTQVALGVGPKVYLVSSLNGRMVLPPLEGHNESITSVVFSPDGTRIATGSHDGTIRVWSTQSGKTELGPLKQEETADIRYSNDSAAFSPDGARLLSTSNTGCAFGMLTTDADNGMLILDQPSLSNHRVRSIKQRNHIYILAFETGKVVLGPLNITAPKMYASSQTFVHSVSFSPNGLYLVCGSSGGICILVLGPLGGDSAAAGFSPDSAYLISCSDKTLHLWDTRSTHKTPGQLRDDNPPVVTQVGFSPNGTRVVSKYNGGFSEILPTQQERSYDEIPVVFSPEGRHLLMNTDRGLVFMDAQTGSITRDPFRSSQSAIQTHSARFSPDGNYIVFGKLREQDVQSRLKSYYPPQVSNHDSFGIGPPRENIVRILEVRQTRLSCGRGFQSVPFATFTTDGAHIITCSTDSDGRQYVVCTTGNFSSFGLSPDGTRFVSYKESHLMVYDVRSGDQVLGPLELHTEWVNSARFSPDDRRIVSGANDKTVCIWDTQTGQPVLGPVKWRTASVGSVDFSPDGTRVVSSSHDNIIRVSDVRAAEVPDPTLQSIGEWELREDGWVVDKFSRLLIWVPSDLRPHSCYLRLNFEGAHIGESWAKSYQPV
ncbi:WD40-repeat-containing domain protein [Rhizoctonia solani]|nr:WD40-repeat-containing domain protein [Rhizoctonia solani]